MVMVIAWIVEQIKKLALWACFILVGTSGGIRLLL